MAILDRQNSLADDRGSDEFMDLSGQFLLAMPGVDSGLFSGTVVYLFEHSSEGAGGVIINRTTDIELGDLIERFELEAPADFDNKIVFFGGPVEPMRGFVLHPPLQDSADEPAAKREGLLQISNSRDVLQDYLQGKGPSQAFICFGYAGWGEGQLEDELRENVWLTIPANHDLIFKHPAHDRYRAAFASMGIDLSYLSMDAGHA